MTQTTHPKKELVRGFMDRRTRGTEPPKSPEEIRRMLGWDLIKTNNGTPK